MFNVQLPEQATLFGSTRVLTCAKADGHVHAEETQNLARRTDDCKQLLCKRCGFASWVGSEAVGSDGSGAFRPRCAVATNRKRCLASRKRSSRATTEGCASPRFTTSARDPNLLVLGILSSGKPAIPHEHCLLSNMSLALKTRARHYQNDANPKTHVQVAFSSTEEPKIEPCSGARQTACKLEPYSLCVAKAKPTKRSFCESLT